MGIALITGACGLIGSEAVKYFGNKDFQVVGIDNDMRKYFFGEEASTAWNTAKLQESVEGYIHKNIDIRDLVELKKVFQEYQKDIKLIIHTAAQPSHDWAAKQPFTDFSINASATLNLLELTRQFCPEAVFIFTSTNKVYGDLPNALPLEEMDTRWDLPEKHAYFNGIDETMSIDQCKHSLFGASKLAADILVQEYGKYFGMKTVSFRGGCLTGPQHSGAELHGFLAYLVKCCVVEKEYTVFGYKGKQVRDNIHSYDLVTAFDHYYQNPKPGVVYNIGGGRENSCSILEAAAIIEKMVGKKVKYQIKDNARIGDHMWYITDFKRFREDYPQWNVTVNLQATLEQICDHMSQAAS